MPRTPKPPPTAEEIESKLLEALRAAGGSMQRNNLRLAIDLHIRAAMFDAVIDDLVRRKVILAEKAMNYRTSVHGHQIPVTATVYAIAGRKPRG